MEVLEALLRELDEVGRALAEVADDDFGRRFELAARRDRLRQEVAAYHLDRDAGRPIADLESELDALEKRREELLKQRIDLVMQHGGGDASPGGGSGWGGVQLNAAIDEAQGLPEVEKRIGRLRNVIEARRAVSPQPE